VKELQHVCVAMMIQLCITAPRFVPLFLASFSLKHATTWAETEVVFGDLGG